MKVHPPVRQPLLLNLLQSHCVCHSPCRQIPSNSPGAASHITSSASRTSPTIAMAETSELQEGGEEEVVGGGGGAGGVVQGGLHAGVDGLGEHSGLDIEVHKGVEVGLRGRRR
ncbi:hypothetical protein Cni_G22901 [Canna indica]|uniref:Uncharacterized protein n=1 Tax=Canna indica TaxID=4628 RepID=A0AAQ3QIQ0_9LILI|nr:hypothetical protein Cni_G22901 [Canna indica]